MAKAESKISWAGRGTIEIRGEAGFVAEATGKVMHFLLTDWIDAEVAKGRDRGEVVSEAAKRLNGQLALIRNEG